MYYRDFSFFLGEAPNLGPGLLLLFCEWIEAMKLLSATATAQAATTPKLATKAAEGTTTKAATATPTIV